MLGHCLDQLLPEPLVRCEGIPSTARVGVTRKGTSDIVHVKTTYPELRGKYNVIEEHNVVHGSVVNLRGDAAARVYTAPDRTPLPYDIVDGYTRIRLPAVPGYLMVVVERQGFAKLSAAASPETAFFASRPAKKKERDAPSVLIP